jgi:phospholipid transport system substrate-binding protein
VFLALASLTNSTLAAEQDAKKAAASLVESLCAQADAVLRDDTLSQDERQRNFGRLILSGMDFNAMGRFVLAEHWQRAAEYEQVEFQTLLADYIVMSFGRHLDSIPGIQTRVMAARQLNARAMSIRSEVKLGEVGAKLYVDWRLRGDGDDWRIFDIVVQGISVASVFRSEFVSVIKANGGEVEGLLQKLRGKTATVASLAS